MGHLVKFVSSYCEALSSTADRRLECCKYLTISRDRQTPVWPELASGKLVELSKSLAFGLILDLQDKNIYGMVLHGSQCGSNGIDFEIVEDVLFIAKGSF
jgi:hypothetical protein